MARGFCCISMGLESYTTQELLDEVLGRMDHAVFCGLFIKTGNEAQTLRRWKGNYNTAAGLAQEMSGIILRRKWRKERPA